MKKCFKKCFKWAGRFSPVRLSYLTAPWMISLDRPWRRWNFWFENPTGVAWWFDQALFFLGKFFLFDFFFYFQEKIFSPTCGDALQYSGQGMRRVIVGGHEGTPPVHHCSFGCTALVGIPSHFNFQKRIKFKSENFSDQFHFLNEVFIQKHHRECATSLCPTKWIKKWLPSVQSKGHDSYHDHDHHKFHTGFPGKKRFSTEINSHFWPLLTDGSF